VFNKTRVLVLTDKVHDAIMKKRCGDDGHKKGKGGGAGAAHGRLGGATGRDADVRKRVVDFN